VQVILDHKLAQQTKWADQEHQPHLVGLVEQQAQEMLAQQDKLIRVRPVVARVETDRPRMAAAGVERVAIQKN
jgi:hypothetical protein